MQFVDMALTPNEAQDMASPTSLSNMPKYPYGLCISFCADEMEKLGIEQKCSVGDFLHLHALAKVTSYSEQETEDGVKPRVEMVLAFIEVEDEGAEDDKEELSMSKITSKLYR